MKRELMEHIGTTILNMTHGSHYGGGTDSSWAAGEVWTHVYGPHFIYCNNITNTITATNQAAQTLYADALAQAAAEQTAWPYSWFTNANYAPAANRGAVTGQIAINDIYNPNASNSNLWVGLVQQPATSTATYDFQKWQKPYQFWAKTGTNGSFAIPNVIAGANYTLYAFGPGAAGTFQSQVQTGGSPPNSVDIPSAPFSVTVIGGTTNHLGTVTWTPTRVGPTVFEIGFPDRNSTEFRHGEDWWVGDIGPSPGAPSPIWSKFLEYPFDFPSGPNYVVGQSRWTTDWNFVQPVVVNGDGSSSASTSTITFNLASAPGATASLYIALSSDDSGPLVVQANGSTVANYTPAYHTSTDESDSTVREGIHGMYTDNRVTFSGSLLRQGQNTITITMNQGGNLANHAMYDYLRLELTGYVPPPPASVAAYAGNNRNLICWPVTPGATSYNLLRSTTSGSGYVSLTNGVVGPVCGSGWNNATFLDTSAVKRHDLLLRRAIGQSRRGARIRRKAPGQRRAPSISTSAPAAPAGLDDRQQRPSKRYAELESVGWCGLLHGLPFHAVQQWRRRFQCFENDCAGQQRHRHKLYRQLANRWKHLQLLHHCHRHGRNEHQFQFRRGRAIAGATRQCAGFAEGKFCANHEHHAELVAGFRRGGLCYQPRDQPEWAVYFSDERDRDDLHGCWSECGGGLLLSGGSGECRGCFAQCHGHRHRPSVGSREPFRHTRRLTSDLSWPAVANAAGYFLYRGTSSNS